MAHRKYNHRPEFGLQNAKDLATNVLMFAVKDWKRNRTRNLIVFFHSDLFRFWCALALIDPDAAREALGVPNIIPPLKKGKDKK